MKNFLEVLSKNKVLIGVVMVLLLIVGIAIGYSFSFFVTSEVTGNNVATTDCFKITYTDANDILLEKAYPISDSEGSALTPYTFVIKNVCAGTMNYEISLETLNTSTLSTNYLKYKLNDTTAILGQQTAGTIYVNTSANESRILDNGTLTGDQEKIFDLRLWVDESSTIEQSANKLYRGKVAIKISTN